MRSRHLAVRDFLNPLQTNYHLNVMEKNNEAKAYLASSSLAMTDKDRLELFSASSGGLELDGSGRTVTADSPSTVIVDQSNRGNTLKGTDGVRNYLRASGGNNNLYGGNLTDELHGGAGNDTYYVKASATIEDTAGEDTLILTGAAGTARDVLWFEKKEGDLLIRFRNDNSRTATVRGYDKPGQKIECIIMNNARLSGGDIDNLASAMALMPMPQSYDAIQNDQKLTDMLNKWTLIGTLQI